MRTLEAALGEIGLAEFHDLFAAHDIDAATLPDLTDDDLRELGLSLGQRKRVLRALREAAARVLQPAAERRQLTTLFCDLAGSTALATQLDPEDLSEIIEAYQTLCAAVVRAHDGFAAFTQGDGLMVYFGFPTAREDDPERAVRCALEISEKLAALKTAAPTPLRARIGIATGRVVVGDRGDAGIAGGNVAGETPNLAARLQAVAREGEIIVSDSTRRLCDALFEYEARGDHALKGFPEPIPVFRVLGESAARSRFEARARGGLTPIVGREVELDRLRALWQLAAAGAGQAALICGEAGIGKSRLASAFMDQIVADAPAMLRWYCAPHLANRALHPVVRELETAPGLARTLSAEARREGLAGFVAAAPGLGPPDAGLLADLLGIEGIVRPELDAATRARRTYELLARRVEGLAGGAPLLLLLEDAHWADAATLDMLGLLLERIARLPVLLLLTHRPEFTPPWPAAASRTAILLQALDAQAGARLVDMVVRQQVLPPGVVRTIIEKAGGVPLFVEELTKAVLEAAIDRSRATVALAALAVPATLHDSLMARLDQLGAAKELAQVGAVIGREFTASMLQVVLPEHPDITSGLRRLRASGLAEGSEDGTGAIVFHHALVQDTAYESLLRRRRREIHRAVAEAMLAGDPAFLGAEPEVIARHCTQGGLPTEAVTHWLAAGRHALDRAAAGAAVTYLRAALEQLALLPEGEDRMRTELKVQLALAPASMAIYGWAATEVEATCRRAVELAQRVDDHVSLFGATWGLWTNFFLRGNMRPALETALSVDRMAVASGQDALLTAADHAVGYTLFFQGELAAAIARADSGIRRYDEATDRQIVQMFQFSSMVALLAFGAPSLWMIGREAEADAALERSIAIARALGHPPSMAFAHAFNCFLPLYRRDWARVRANAEAARRLSEEEGFQMWLPLAQLFLGLCDAQDGRLDAGLASALQAFDRFAATGTGCCQALVHGPIGEMLIRAGRADEAARRLDAMIDAATARHERVYLSELHRVRAAAKLALGESEAAHRDLQTACDIAESQGAIVLLRRAQDDLRLLPA